MSDTLGKFVSALLNAEHNALVDAAEPEGVINMTPCPCCGRNVPDTILKNRDGARFPIRGLFHYRMDLLEFVCLKCDAELGSDTVREKLKAMCSKPAEVTA